MSQDASTRIVLDADGSPLAVGDPVTLVRSEDNDMPWPQFAGRPAVVHQLPSDDEADLNVIITWVPPNDWDAGVSTRPNHLRKIVEG
jgi:hypothetical protein